MKTKKWKIIVVGGGFAGIEIVKRFNAKVFDVMLIDKINHHQFQPLFYQVATSQLEPSSISFPLRSVFNKNINVKIRLAVVLNINTNANTITTNIGDFQYDYLIIAIGCKTNFFGNKDIQKHSFTLKSTYDAILIRNHILQAFEKIVWAKEQEKEGLLNLVIVGAGPTGVELAGAFAEIKKNILPKDYHGIDFSRFKIMLIEGTKNTLNNMSENAQHASKKYLQEMGVSVYTETFVSHYDGETLVLKNGNTIKTKTVIWAAGVIGNSIKGLPNDCYAAGSRIKVNRINKIAGLTNIFAIGDIAFMETPLYPKGHPQLASVAINQAKHLAKNLERIVNDTAPVNFEYQDLGTMATVGRNKAVVDLPFIKFNGYLAWLIWMCFHLMLILSVKNKLIIFINWIWAYTTKDTSLNLILTPVLTYSNQQIIHCSSDKKVVYEKINMSSLVPVINHLSMLGFKSQFKVTELGLISLTSNNLFQPEDIEIVQYYRFEGESDPDDNAILYSIKTCNGEKGTLVDAYGVYNDAKITNYMQSVKMHNNKPKTDMI
jgi:NADH dehydrogenase